MPLMLAFPVPSDSLSVGIFITFLVSTFFYILSFRSHIDSSFIISHGI